jgi:hypothetical protein
LHSGRIERGLVTVSQAVGQNLAEVNRRNPLLT